MVLPAPVWPTMATVCPGATRKETSRRTQSSSAGLGFVGVAEPDVAEFDFAARGFEADGVGGRDRGGWFVEEFEDALGGGHGGLQDVEFFAEVLDRAKEARGVHRESGEDAEAQGAVEYAIAARPIDEGYREDAEDFYRWIKEREREDGVAPGQHVVAIAAAKFGAGFLFAIEELHDAHAGNVFLKIGIDAGNGGTYAAVGVADEQAEEIGDDEDEGEDGEGVEGEAMVDGKKPAGEDREEEEVVDHGDDAGGEKIVEGVDVGGNAGDQAADRVAVEVRHGQTLNVAEDRGAHVVHGLLADALHDADLDVLGEEVEDEDAEENDADDQNTAPCLGLVDGVMHSGNEIFVDRDLEQFGRSEFERRHDGHKRERQNHTPAIRAQILQQAAQEVCVVGFAERFFFVNVAHAFSSSSSSNCLRYKSA